MYFKQHCDHAFGTFSFPFRLHFVFIFVSVLIFKDASLESSAAGSSQMTPSVKRKRQSTMKHFTDTTSDIERESLDEIIAEFFFGNNIPFSVVESSTFRKMVKKFRPSYVPPSRRNLSSKLLDKVNEKLVEEDNTFQKDGCCLAEAVELWLTLIANSPSELVKLAKQRCEKSKVTALLANYLHPHYRGQQFDNEQKKIVNDAILDIPDITDASVDYEDKTGLFRRLNNINGSSQYWRYAQKYDECKSLATFALKLMNLPASTARIERLFSNWTFVHSDDVAISRGSQFRAGSNGRICSEHCAKKCRPAVPNASRGAPSLSNRFGSTCWSNLGGAGRSRALIGRPYFVRGGVGWSLGRLTTLRMSRISSSLARRSSSASTGTSLIMAGFGCASSYS